MGHSQISRLARTAQWQQVVSLIAAGADVSQVAAQTMEAAEKAFKFVLRDSSYTEVVALMTELALAGKTDNFSAFLSSIGLNLSPMSSLADVSAAVTETLDQRFRDLRIRSDLGELAQKALVGALVDHISPKLPTLFESDGRDIKGALENLSKPKEFGNLSRAFFARLTESSMEKFLSKALTSQIGDYKRFATLNQVSQFEEALKKHCRETSVIVEKFSREWFSKHKWGEQLSYWVCAWDGFRGGWAGSSPPILSPFSRECS